MEYYIPLVFKDFKISNEKGDNVLMTVKGRIDKFYRVLQLLQ
jgi:hypothetical protein